jgi:urease beta subunit
MRVTLQLASNPGNAVLTGTVAVNAVGGVATFADVSIDKVASGYTLSASAPAVSGATSEPFAIAAGGPAQLVFTSNPSDVTAGQVIMPPVEVTVQDAFGNVAAGAPIDVTLELAGPSPNAPQQVSESSEAASSSVAATPAAGAAADEPTLHGNTTVTAISGVATFDDLWIDGAASGYTLRALAGGLTSGSSASFTTTPAAPVQIGFETQPSDGIAAAPIPPVQVAIQDRFGNAVTTTSGSATVVLAANPGGATLSGTLTRTIINGVATFDDLSLEKVASGYTLTATVSGYNDVTSDPFAIGAGEATQLRFRTQPSDADAFIPIAPPIEVEFLDSFGNPLTTASQFVTLAMGSNPGGGSLSGIKTVAPVNGVATFNNVWIDMPASGYTLQASATGLVGATSNAFTISEGRATQLGFRTQPSDALAGVAIAPPIQVGIHDAMGNLLATANQAVTVAIDSNPGGGVLSGTATVSAVGGIATFSDLQIDQAAAGYSLSATTSGLTGATSNLFDITAGPATRYVILDPPDGIVGVPILVTVQAQDQFGNVATGENRGVTLLPTGSADGGFVFITNGTGTVLVEDQVAETVTLRLADTEGTNLDVSSTQSVTFAPAGATQYVIVDPTDGMIRTPITITVQAQDQYGNLVAAENRDVTLAVSGSATGGGLVDIQNGVGTIDINDQVPETVTLTLQDTEGTGLDVSSTQDVVFTSSTATRIEILDPTDGTVDAPVLVVLRAMDEFGNVATGENRGVTMLASGSAVGGFVNFTSGVGTLLLYDDVAETVTLSLVDTELTGLDVSSTQNVVFAPGAVTQYVILDPADGVIESPITVTVQAQDQYGNLVPSENRDVTLVASGSATGGGLVNIQNGVGTRNITDAVPETVTLSLSDTESTGLNVSSTQTVVFAAGTATRFVIQDPADGTVDAPILVAVRALDQFGNVATGENRGVTLQASGSAFGGFVNITNGVGTVLIDDQVAETVTLSLLDTELTGLDVSSTQTVVFAPGAVTKYVILEPPDGMINDPIPVTVQAQDQYGNLVTGENRDVTLVASGSATGDGLVNITNGVGTRSITDAVPETVTLSLSDTQGTGLNVSSTQTVVFAAGAATRFVIQDPADGTVDAPILVTVLALDQWGNVATGENRGVTLETSGSAFGDFVNFVAGQGTALISDQVAETVTLSLLDTEATGLDVSSTQTVFFGPGAGAQYVILDPTDGPILNPITVTVQAQDQYGNLVPSENRDVTLVTSGSATGGGLVNIQNGVGTRNINDAVPETVTLSLSDTQGTGLDVSSTQDVVFGAGPATKLVILNPTDGTVDAPIMVTVQAQDEFGNLATGENRGVTLVASGSALGDFVNIVNGVGTTFVFDQVAETVTLSLSDTQGTGLDVSSTQDVVFSVGAVARYVILDLTDGTVGIPLTVTVRAADQYGNLVTGENRDVTLVTSGSATGGGLVDIVNGVGTRDITDAVPEIITLSLSDTEGTGLNVSSTQQVMFSAGAATKFVIMDPIDGTTDHPILVTVQAQDQFGNVATGENRGVTLVTSGAASGGFVSVVEGVGAILVYDEVVETVQLSLADTQGTGLDVSSTQDVVFAIGAVARYAILDPTDGPVGTPVTVTVQAQDQWGNVFTAENRDVTLVASGSATGDGLVNIQNGVGTLNINDAVPETVSLSLSDTQGTGLDVSSTQDVVFSAGAATRFVIDDPADGTVGSPITVTVRALDALGNVATSESRGVTLVASGSAVGGLVNITSGVGSVNVTDQVAETVTLSLSDTQGTGLDVTSTQTVVFAAGAANRFVILDPTNGTVGTPIPVTVQAQDQYGNLVSGTLQVTLVTSGSATGGGLWTVSGGTVTRNIEDTVAETVSLSLSDTQGTGLNVSSTQDVVFSSGGATRFVIDDPADGTVDNPITVTVRALDALGNVATSENRGVTLVTSGSAVGGLVNITSGVGSVNVTDQVAETVTLSLSDTQGTELDVTSTQTVVFAVGAANRFVILDPTDGTAGTPIPVTVQAQDQYGNLVSGTLQVTLVTSGSATGGGLWTVSGGTVTQNIEDAVAETVTLTLSDSQGTGLNVSSTQDVVFGAAPPPE